MENMVTFLFPIIRAAFDINYQLDTPTAEICEELAAFGKKQSILPIIYMGLKKAGVPEDLLKAIDYERSRDIKRFMIQNYSLQEIETVLNAAQIPYILLKGAVLRHFYPSPEMRTSSDIDVLVQETNLDRAVNELEKHTDFKAVYRGYHDISMFSSAVHLELHFSIKENVERNDKLLSRAWEYAKPFEESKYIFTPEFQIFHVVVHMSHHFLYGGLGIRPFLDLWLLRNKTVFDENIVREMCQQCGIGKFYEECCNLTDVWLGESRHTETTEMLEQFCVSGGVFGTKEFKNAARQREHRGVKYILSRVLPPASQVKGFYSSYSEEDHSMAYYYVKRWISWGKRRKELKRQVGEIMSTDKQYIDKTDELLRRLGMA